MPEVSEVFCLECIGEGAEVRVDFKSGGESDVVVDGQGLGIRFQDGVVVTRPVH